ncbi:MAG: hypothetical protein ACYDHU_04975 [Acidimicrobiales bacterium]
MSFERPGGPGTPEPGWSGGSGGSGVPDGDARVPELEGLDGLDDPELEGLDGLDDPELEAWAASRPRRKHAGGVRVVGIVVVVALIVASVGTAIELVLGGSSGSGGATLPTRVTSTVPLGNGGSPIPGGTGSAVTAREVRVTFTVTNTSGQSVVPQCSISVDSRSSVVGSVTVHGERAIPVGTTSTGHVTVPLLTARPADSLSRDTVTCLG